jgi:Zinc finger found in FPG and IleRS
MPRIEVEITHPDRVPFPADGITKGELVDGLPRWLTGVRDEPGPRCPRCGARLSRGRIGGRTPVWCPRCQRN